MTAQAINKGGRPRSRTLRIQTALEHHQPHPYRANTCTCMFPILDGDTMTAHQARAVGSAIFGLEDKDLDRVDMHRPGPENIAIHRALKEPLCASCQAFLRSLG